MSDGLVIDRLRAIPETGAVSAAVASWLIAQGLGPSSKPVALLSDDGPESALMLFGALRAGVAVTGREGDAALVFARDSAKAAGALDRAAARGARIVTVDGRRGIALAALKNCSIDASVTERRLHIAADTPAVVLADGTIRTHGELTTLDTRAILAGSAPRLPPVDGPA